MFGQLHLRILNALNYARGMCADHLLAVHVCVDTDGGSVLKRKWEQLGIEVRIGCLPADDCPPDPQIRPAVPAP